MGGLQGSSRWDVLPHNAAAEHALVEACGVTPLVARILVARGIVDPHAVRDFLSPSLERDWADPMLIPGMREAANRVEQALAQGESIAVFGDFDVDGMTATCLLTLALRELGGKAYPFIPNRFGEGYGLSQEALARVMAACNPQLVITVDNGIAAAREVEWLTSQGVDVVITDHHEPSELVPRGVPVTDPKLDPNCSSRELAGAGVALKLVHELGRRLKKPNLWRSYTEIAALGTISDMMLLRGENRSLVADGIARLRQTCRPGIVALAASAGIELAESTADSLPFSLIPRLNAAGRMGSTDVAFELLMEDDPARAAQLASALEQINSERRQIETALSEEVLAEVACSYTNEPVIVVAGKGWHEGVKGIVASRVTNRYHVPAILFSIDDEGIARGSGRSVGTVDLFHAVDQCSELLVRFGGHAGAVGVTCEATNLEAFRKKLVAVMAELPKEQFLDKGEVAAVVQLSELTERGIAELDVLQPFGQGNKKPLLGVQGVTMRCRACVGAAGNHLRFSATDGISCIPAIMFRTPNIKRASTCEDVVDLVFEAINENWQGRTKPKLMVRDILYRDAAASSAKPGASIADQLFERAGQIAHTHLRQSACCGHEATTKREQLSRLSSPELTELLRAQMIGEHALLPAQQAALDNLSAGRSTLCVMATGRGKSLIFHIHAARQALLAGKASVFVYPLRALVADQSFHLADAFARLGLSVRVLTGETLQKERNEVFSELASGSLDVLLTTPEFLAIHAARFAEAGRVGFVVVDEAHHAGSAKGGQRSAYTQFPEVLARLGKPCTLALTATASSEVAQEICTLLGIAHEDVIIDASVRDNLAIDDHRELRDRDAALVSLVASGKKTVVYVNSRDQSIALARMLRKHIPELGPAISFYNAGLTREERTAVEQAFRSGELRCIVSTSAFGEGVNLPDIRNVVLYHMPFGSVEFNQMSGRAGRDGNPARVTLLFGEKDAQINERIVRGIAPKRRELVALYRTLMTLDRSVRAQASPEDSFQLSNSDIAAEAAQIDARAHFDEHSVSSAIGIFRELGFLETLGYGASRRVRMVPKPEHVELEESIRYQEGMRSRDAFAQFKQWASTAAAHEMLERINRPIVPTFGRHV